MANASIVNASVSKLWHVCGSAAAAHCEYRLEEKCMLRDSVHLARALCSRSPLSSPGTAHLFHSFLLSLSLSISLFLHFCLIALRKFPIMNGLGKSPRTFLYNYLVLCRAGSWLTKKWFCISIKTLKNCMTTARTYRDELDYAHSRMDGAERTIKIMKSNPL